MIRTTLSRLALSATLVVTIPITVAAQGEAATPVGVEWHLAGYAVDGEIGIVPWQIDATLLLEGGVATGSTGCNQFSGNYTLDGTSLTFDPAVAMTRMACPDDQSAVEDGYLVNLPQTATWTIEDGALMLADAAGDHILGFEQTVIALTASDIAAISAMFADQQAQIDQFGGRIDRIRIGTLRDRIKTLEAQVKKLQAQRPSTSSPTGTSLSKAEQTLLKGIPTSIRSTCSALRGNNPAGTLAAVQCQPNARVVGEMAYAFAKRTFNSVMASYNVPQGHRCPAGRASRGLLHPASGEGCFVDASGRANVRLIELAAGCNQLNIDGKQVATPTIYVALEGKDRRIAPLYDWTRDRHGGSSVTRSIPHGSQPLSPVCKGGF